MVLELADVNLGEISYNLLSANNKKRVYVNKNNKSREAIQVQLCDATPQEFLRAPFGISDPPQGVAEPSRRTMELSVSDGELVSFVEKLTESMINYLCENSEKVFGKVLNEAIIRDRFTSPLRKSTMEGRSDLLRVKIPENCEFLLLKKYDTEGSQMHCSAGNMSCIEKMSRILPSVEISAMWFMAKDLQFGFSLTLLSAIIDCTDNVRKGPPKGANAFVMADGFSMTIESPSPQKRGREDDDGDTNSPKKQKEDDGDDLAVTGSSTQVDDNNPSKYL